MDLTGHWGDSLIIIIKKSFRFEESQNFKRFIYIKDLRTKIGREKPNVKIKTN